MASTSNIQPSNARLQAILDDVNKGHIKIPAFQRGFIWEDDQVVSLLDSIYNGYPVGSALLWSAKKGLAHDRNLGGFALPETPEDYPVNYVLDGQQRLTTLYSVFHADSPTTDAELSKRFKICFDPKTMSFIAEDQADSAKTVPLVKCLNTTTLIAELARFNAEEQKVILQMQDRFKDYEFPIVTIRERSNLEVCKIFQRINSSGTKLSELDLLTAWTWTETFDLRREIKELLDTLEKKGFRGG